MSFELVVAQLLPHSETEAQRRMLLVMAFNTHPAVLAKVDYSGAAAEFVSRTVRMLQVHGEVEASKQGLWHLLLTLKNFVGADQQVQIDALEVYANTPQSTPSSSTVFRVKITKPIFISYSRANRPFAEHLRQELLALGFQVWRDVHDMQIGDDWWRQIQEALASSHTMVLCLSAAALASPVVAQEWHTARQMGVRVMPILAADVDFSTVPRWMGRKDWADFRAGRPERDAVWQRFLDQLNKDYEPRRVPFMTPALPLDFVPRSHELATLIHMLVDETQGAVARTVALKGAGGYGKTTLSQAICHDPHVRGAFDDGILWVTLGEKISENDLIAKMLNLVVMLTNERPPVTDIESAKAKLSEAVGDAYLLFVIDDVWQSGHLKLFIELGKNVTTLITTRNSGILPPQTRLLQVDAMQTDEAVQLLSTGLAATHEHEIQLKLLASRLGEWALLLKLANRQLVDLQTMGLAAVLVLVNQLLDEQGFTALDNPDDPDSRNRAAAASLEVSFGRLEPTQREQFQRLAIFAEDVSIPLATLEKLWNIHTAQAVVLCKRLDALSLLLAFDLNTQTIRLHDIVRTYLRDIYQANLPAWNQQFLERYRTAMWHTLPSDELYLWHWLGYHLREAGKLEELRALLLDFRFLHSKLNATEVNALLQDFADWSADSFKIIRRALQLSAHVLRDEKHLLAGQLIGRLLADDLPEIRQLIAAAQNWRELSWWMPLTASLTQSRSSLLRTITGHANPVRSLASSPDQHWLVSGDAKGLIKVWNAETGVEKFSFNGHKSSVNALIVTAEFIISASGSEYANTENTIAIWHLETGELLRVLRGHRSKINSLALGKIEGRTYLFSAAGSPLAALDNTVKVWELATGKLTMTLRDFNVPINALAALSNGLAMGLNDHQVVIWSFTEQRFLLRLVGHTAPVRTVAFSPDERWLVSGGDDHMVRVWDLQNDGKLLHLLRGHTAGVTSVIVTADNQQVVSAASDALVKAWDLALGSELHTYRGHASAIHVLGMAGDLIVSAGEDTTIKFWDNIGQCDENTIMWHDDAIQRVVILGDGQHFASASKDGFIKIWELASGQLVVTLRGHTAGVNALAVAPNQTTLVSAADDLTLRVWDSQHGLLLHKLSGHSGAVHDVAYSPDGTKVASVSWGHSILIWDTTNWQILHKISGHADEITALCITSDGQHLVTASCDKTLKIWDLSNGQEVKTLKGHHAEVTTVTCSSDGQYLVSGSKDHTLMVWEMTTGSSVKRLEGHHNSITTLAMPSNDGSKIVAGDQDGKLLIWDWRSEQQTTCFKAESPISSCSITADGTTIIVGECTGRLHLLRMMAAL